MNNNILKLTADQGATFNKVRFRLVGNDLTGCDISMKIRRNHTGDIMVNLTSASNAGFTIVTPTEGLFELNEIIWPLVGGKYIGDLFIIYPTGKKMKYVTVELTIIPTTNG